MQTIFYGLTCKQTFLGTSILLVMFVVYLGFRNDEVFEGIDESSPEVPAVDKGARSAPAVSDKEISESDSPLKIVESETIEISARAMAILMRIEERRLERETLAMGDQFTRFLEITTLSEESLDLLFQAGAMRGLLAREVKNQYDNGYFENSESANVYYKSEFEELTRAIRTIAGEEYDLFQEETEKIGLRKEVDVLSVILKRSGHPINAEQQERLVDLYWIYMKSANVRYSFNPEVSKFNSGFEFTRQMKGRNEAYTLSNLDAQEFLSAAQLELLRKFQSDQITGYYRRTARY